MRLEQQPGGFQAVGDVRGLGGDCSSIPTLCALLGGAHLHLVNFLSGKAEQQEHPPRWWEVYYDSICKAWGQVAGGKACSSLSALSSIAPSPPRLLVGSSTG